MAMTIAQLEQLIALAKRHIEQQHIIIDRCNAGHDWYGAEEANKELIELEIRLARYEHELIELNDATYYGLN